MAGQCSVFGSSNTYHGALSSGFQNISYFVKFYKIINFGKTISFLWNQSMSKYNLKYIHMKYTQGYNEYIILPCTGRF